MSVGPTGLTTRADAQDTFIAPAYHPARLRACRPVRFAAVLRHRAQLTEWAARLGYRLVITGSVARLHRDPAGPQRTAAPATGDPPSRRVAHAHGPHRRGLRGRGYHDDRPSPVRRRAGISGLSRARASCPTTQIAEPNARPSFAGLTSSPGWASCCAAPRTRHSFASGRRTGRGSAPGSRSTRLRVTTAEKAAALIDAHGKAVSAADTETAKARDARTRLSKAQRVTAEREAAVESAITVVAKSLSSWARSLDEPICPPAELLESWSGLVSGLVEAQSPAPVLATAIGRDHLIPVRRPHDQHRAALDRDLTVNTTARKALQAQLGSIEAERDPSPRDPEFWLRRQRPEGVTTIGAPFWRLIETLDGAPAAELEAALDASGLLQAWVTSDGTYLSGRDGSETVWSATTGATHAESSLRTVLRPADDASDLADVVERLLASVAYGKERLPATDAAIAADGHWRHGELTGWAAPSEDAPRLLGAAARSADRERRITQLRDQLTDLTDEHELLSLELEEVTRLLGALDAASEQLPTDTEVVSVVLLARDAAQQVEDAAAEAEHAAEAERDARSAVDAAAADVADHCGEHSLPRTHAEVGVVIRAVSGYESLLSSLDAALSLINPLRDAAGQAAEALDGFRETAAIVSRDAEHDRADAVSLRTKSSAAKAALAQDAQEILLEVNQLRHRIKAADGTLKRLAIEHEALTRKLSRAETVLEQAEAKRQDAEAERESAVTRWWGCVDTGLPRLRGVLEPPARHVTAALETAQSREVSDLDPRLARGPEPDCAAGAESLGGHGGIGQRTAVQAGATWRPQRPGHTARRRPGRLPRRGRAHDRRDGRGTGAARRRGAALLPADPVAGRLRRGTH